MKQLLLVLLLIPSLVFGAFTEFYCTSTGSNLNAGSTTGNNAVYTSAGGNWTNATRVFTVTDGTNPSSSVSVGDWGAVYVTAGATATGFVGRVSNVQNATNGTVTFNSAFAGTNPSNGSGTMTLKTGGAWVGPGAAVTFPFSLSNLGNLNDGTHSARLNFKNDQTYSLTTAVTMTLQAVTLQGYTGSVNDGGKAKLTSNVTSGTNFTVGGTAATCTDIEFENTGGSGTNALVSAATAGATFIRCVFHGARGDGLLTSTQSALVFESESYDCNKSNTASKGGFNITTGSHTTYVNCYSHDHASGSNANGFVLATSTGGGTYFNCIADTCAGSGFYAVASTGSGAYYFNCDSYNNTGDGIKNANTGSPNQTIIIANCNLLKNGGAGINMAPSGSVPNNISGFSYNNGYGAGTQANGSSDTLSNLTESGKITYASNITPWNAPTTGDFTLVSTNTHAGYNAGRGHFEENDGTKTGTVGYPDIGSAQHNDSCAGTGPCQTSGASAY